MLGNIQNKIMALKKERDTLILAHSYQSPEIIEIADAVGDSFALSNIALKYPQRNIILCGVKFMAETVKILSPEKTVILPSPTATCPMAEQLSPQEILNFKAKNPIFKVVSYINTTIELKAVSDVCVTSSSAIKIVEKIKEPVLFIPDKNLGSFVKASLPGKDIILMNGCCPVHNAVTEEDVKIAKGLYPDAKLAAHPELKAEVLKHADYIGSTSGIIDYASKIEGDIIIGTEKSISDHLSLKYPMRSFPLLSKKLMCPDMRITTLLDVYKALVGTGGLKIELDEELRLRAKVPIDAMIEMGK
ncbi:MAG: quinolinate synthase NadA [Oscillospiraceae bacterium]|jgi:quinolinate synthase